MEALETELIIQRDRERLLKAREDAEERIRAAQAELAEIERRFRAIEAFEAAIKGGGSDLTRVVKQSPRQRASRGQRQQELLDIVRKSPGITATEILETLGVRSKDGAAIRSALFNLKKSGKLAMEGRGRYVIAG